MDNWTLVAALAASALTATAVMSWISILKLPSMDSSNYTEMTAGVQRAQSGDSNYASIFIFTFIGALIALIWTWITGFHWITVIAFMGPYATGYMWGRVVLKIRLKQPFLRTTILSLIVTFFTLCAIVVAVDTAAPVPSIFQAVILRFSIGATQEMINGYALLGGGSLVLTSILLVTLTIGSGRDFKTTLQKIERIRIDSEGKQPDDVLRLKIKQGLDRGEKVSTITVPHVDEVRIRNMMAVLVQEFTHLALNYDPIATTLAYGNAEGVHRIHTACSRVTQTDGLSVTERIAAAKELAQAFVTELGLPPISSGISLPHNYFPMVIGKTGGLLQGFSREFPIFIPMLSDQQIRDEEQLSETFRKLFRAAGGKLGSNFGLILSPNSLPLLKDRLTQPAPSGFKQNVVYLDEGEMRTIITSREEPRRTFSKRVGKQIRFMIASPFLPGGPTPGEAFVGRSLEMSNILQNIASRSYVILGARRIGKTSMCKQVESELRGRGYKVFDLNCQEVETYQEFFRLIRSQWAKDPGTRSFADDLPMTFREMAVSLSRSTQSNQPPIFVFDEIDRLLQFDMNQEHPELLFRTFRALSEQNVSQFIFLGERTIYRQLQNVRSPLFNFPVPIKLGLLKEDEAQQLIEKPLRGLGIDLEDVTNMIVDACSRHPHLLQEMGNRICELLDDQPGESEPKVTKEMVTDIVNQRGFRNAYREDFWGQSRALEKAITLLAPSDGSIALSDLVSRLKQHGFQVSQEQLDTALDYLTLYCVFQYENQGLRWRATHFKEVVSKTIVDQQQEIARLQRDFSKYEGAE